MTCTSKLSMFSMTNLAFDVKIEFGHRVLSELSIHSFGHTHTRMRGCSLKENRFVDLFHFVPFHSVRFPFRSISS